MADGATSEALGVDTRRNAASAAGASELAQASYFAEIMRAELEEARKAAKDAQRRWSGRRVKDDQEIPERVLWLKRRVREANLILKELEARFPEIS